MQTRPRPPASDLPDDSTASNLTPPTVPVPSRPAWARRLNFAIALVILGLALLDLSKGWSGYAHFPGGRKVLFGLGILVLVGLVAGRIWLALGRQGLRRVALGASRDARVREALPVSVILLLAFIVRVWGINFGMPYLEQVDEWNVAERGLNIIQTGSFDPHDYRHPGLADNDRQAFTYPTLYTYMQTGVYGIHFLQGVNAGVYDGTSSLEDPLVKDDFYLWGRGLTAFLGAATVLLVYLLGRRAYSKTVGLVGALFLSFFYLHVLNSHWITTDVPSGFMALLPLLWIFPILEGRDERKHYLLVGILSGLAVATKYNDGLILVPLILAHLLGRPVRRWVNWNIPLALAAAFVGFAIGAPFVFFHFPDFLTDVSAVINHYQNVGHAGFEGSTNWLQYFSDMLDQNSVIAVLSLVGVVIMAARHQKRDVVLLSFPLLTYLQLSGYKVNFSRNLMPVVPFVTLFAAFGLVQLVSLAYSFLTKARPDRPSFTIPKWAPALVLGVVTALAIVGPAAALVQYDSYNALPTNRASATAWIEANVPHGAKLWLEPLSTDLLPRTGYQLEGGTGVLAHPPAWYAANGYHYLVLSEAYYKESLQSGNANVQAQYRTLTEGPLPAGLTVAQDFKKSNAEAGARILILNTGLPLLTTTQVVSQTAKPLSLEFGGSLRLIGWQAPASLTAGSTVLLNFYWQTVKPVNQDYTTFLHLLDGKGNIVAQLDLKPFAGTRPTSQWQTGEVSHDDYPFSLPANLPTGSYRLTLGLYIAPNGARLALPDGQTEATVGMLEVAGTK